LHIGFVFLISIPYLLVCADDLTHIYEEDEPVHFYVHKVGPLANPQEAYPYYDVPYCAPDIAPKDIFKFNEDKSSRSLAEQLGGHALRHSGHTLLFATKQSRVESCKTKELTVEQVEIFTNAVKNDWFYQMYIDDLPIWGMVGELNADGKSLVFTSRKITIKYNGDRIIKVDLIPDRNSLKEVQPGKDLSFQTNFVWEKTTEKFHSRFDRYLDNKFFKHQIHWFSIFNSFMMVLFLTGLVSLIMVRTLRKDYARYAISGGDFEEGEDFNVDGDATLMDENGKPLAIDDAAPLTKRGGMPTEDSGWKQVHGDVFRAPWLLTIVAAIIGSGWQLIVLTLGVILFAVAGPIHGAVHEDRGELEHAILCCYCLSSIVAGYASGSYFKMYTPVRPGARGKSGGTGGGDSAWQLAMLLTAVLLPTICGGIVLYLNAIALTYGTVNYIPFFALVKLFLLWIFISLPLCILGTLLGRNAKKGGSSEFPCRVNAIPRPIPDEVPSYGKPMNLIPFAGLLSFGSIFIELYYVLTSLWNYKIYHVYEFLLGVYAILIIVVSMTTIIVVYFCLNSENYLWQWIGLASGGSTAGYVFLYGVYFFMFKTGMTGFLQTSYYFCYMTLISLNLGILCGTIGHFAASKFVRTIFKNVKVD